jgi:hypothetical protein
MLKLRAVPIHAAEALGWRGGIARTHSRPRHWMGVSGQRHAPAALGPGERTPGTHCTGGWVDLRTGLDTEARGKTLSPLHAMEALGGRGDIAPTHSRPRH